MGGAWKRFGAEPPERRCAFGEHRVGQPELTAQLEQHGRMSEAIQAAVRRRVKLFARERIDGQGACRHGAVRLVEQHIPHDAKVLRMPSTGRGLTLRKRSPSCCADESDNSRPRRAAVKPKARRIEPVNDVM